MLIFEIFADKVPPLAGRFPICAAPIYCSAACLFFRDFVAWLDDRPRASSQHAGWVSMLLRGDAGDVVGRNWTAAERRTRVRVGAGELEVSNLDSMRPRS